MSNYSLVASPTAFLLSGNEVTLGKRGIETDIQSLTPGTIVEMFVVDLTAFGGTILRFHSGVGLKETGGTRNSIVWQGQTYSPAPIAAEGFEWSGRGTLPRPKLKIATIPGLMSVLFQYQDLSGALVTRKRTLAKYLDAVNFPNNKNSDADPNASFPDEVYIVDRKVNANKVFVEFELTVPWDMQGVKLPRRQIIQNLCSWGYKSAECGWVNTSYTTGTVSVQNGIAVVTGTNTAWMVGAVKTIGKSYRIKVGADTATYEIQSVDSATQVTLKTAYGGTTGGGKSYVVTNYFKSDDTSTALVSEDFCPKRLTSCYRRFGDKGDTQLPFGGFPGANLMSVRV